MIESISAGLIISLINKYIINTTMFETCITETQEEEDSSEGSSVVAGVSDSTLVHQVHHIHF